MFVFVVSLLWFLLFLLVFLVWLLDAVEAILVEGMESAKGRRDGGLALALALLAVSWRSETSWLC